MPPQGPGPGAGPMPPMPPHPPMMPPMGGPPPNVGKLVGNGQPSVVAKAGEVRHPNLPNIAGTNEKPTIPGVSDI
jgi:hypothetical protein